MTVICQECALGSSIYVPCGKPAVAMIGWKGRSDTPIPMCEMCADHNLRNRGGEQVAAPLQAIAFPEPISEVLPPRTKGPSVGDMIAKYHELKAYVEAEQGKVDEHLKPFKDAMRTLQTACGVALQEQKLQNFKSEDGTAYLRHDLGVKVDNKADFLKFVRSTEAWDMLDVRALKDPVCEYAAKHEDAAPPGILFEPSVACIIRK